MVLRPVARIVAFVGALLVVGYALVALLTGGLLEVLVAALPLVPYAVGGVVVAVVAAFALYRPARSVARTFLVEALARQQVRLAATLVGLPTITVGVAYVLAVGATGRALPSASIAIVAGLAVYKFASVVTRLRAGAGALVPERSAPPHVLVQCAVLRVDLSAGASGVTAADRVVEALGDGLGRGPGRDADYDPDEVPDRWYYVRVGRDHELLHPDRSVVVRDAAYLAGAVLSGDKVVWRPPRLPERVGLKEYPSFADRPPSMWAAEFALEYGLVHPDAIRAKVREKARKAVFYCLRTRGPVVSAEELEPFVGPFPDPVVAELVREHRGLGNVRRLDDGALKLQHDPFNPDHGARGPLALPRHRKLRR